MFLGCLGLVVGTLLAGSGAGLIGASVVKHSIRLSALGAVLWIVGFTPIILCAVNTL